MANEIVDEIPMLYEDLLCIGVSTKDVEYVIRTSCWSQTSSRWPKSKMHQQSPKAMCYINVEKANEGVHFFFNGILNSTFISNKHVFLCKTVLYDVSLIRI